MSDFTIKVIGIIKNIPMGYVMTYGQIAELAGSPRGARQVSRILHSMTKSHNLPWHRVIGKTGQLTLDAAIGGCEQRLLLESEGIIINDDGIVDLSKYLFSDY